MVAKDRYLVTFDPEAVSEMRDVKGASEREAIRRVVDRLARLGPKIGPASMKSLKGAPGVLELRPRAGDSPHRLLASRKGRHYVILAVARKKGFARGLSRAQTRLKKYEDGIIK